MLDSKALTWKIKLLGLAAVVVLHQMPRQGAGSAAPPVASASRQQSASANHQLALVDARKGRAQGETPKLDAAELHKPKPRKLPAPRILGAGATGT